MVKGLKTKEDFENMFPPDELDEIGDRWLIRWRGSQKLRYRICLNILRQALANSNKVLRVLDIGCGQSDFLLRLREMYPGHEYHGTDISENVVAWNRRNYPFIKYQQIALPEIGFRPSTFDLICALEVLYYLEVPQQKVALGNIVEALKPGGYLLLSGPLDGGKQYYAEDRIIQAVGRVMSIERVEYNYARLYTYLEMFPLRALSLLRRIGELLSLPNADFEQWAARRRGWIIGTVRIARQRGTKRVVSLVTAALIWLLKTVLGWEWLPRLCFVLTKIALGNAGRTQIIILARKLGNQPY